jgi:hypothetical protein
MNRTIYHKNRTPNLFSNVTVTDVKFPHLPTMAFPTDSEPQLQYVVTIDTTL